MAQQGASAGNSAKILIVDDSPTQLEQLRFLLEEAGFSIVAATSGDDGLAAARANEIDLVVSDVVMPGIDGYGLCKALRADEKLRHLPVILLTSLTDPRDVIRGLESGANNFICKPYEDAALLARVRNVLTNQEIRKTMSSEMGINIFFAGQPFFITADRLQILDLLLSTYENAVLHNTELTRTRDELRILNEQLEARVAERTAALAAEVAERQRSQEHEHHLNSVLRAIRGVNQLIVREKDPLRLIQQACEILAETRGYRGVWIALDGRGGPPLLAAQAGWDAVFEPFSEGLREGRLPSCWGQARTAENGLAVIDTQRACGECPLWESGGHEAAIVVLLRHGPRDFGTLGIRLAPEKEIDEDEMSLLVEVAGDLGLALHGIETERRRAAYAQIVASSQDAMALVDRGYVYQEANSSYARLVGHDEGAIIGHRSPEVLGEEYFRNIEKPNLDRCFQGETVFFEASRDVPGKGPVFFEAQFSPCRTPDGSGSSAAVSIRDITERKRAEEALKASEEKFKRLFDESPASIALVDTKGILREANLSLLTLLAVSKEELLGKGFATLASEFGLDTQQQLADFRERLTGGRPANELTFHNRGGEQKTIAVQSSTVMSGGQVTGILFMVQDITAQKRSEAERDKLQDQLRMSQKMEAIGSLAGGVAHDFNNLLSVILSYAGFLLDDMREDDPQREDLLEVKKAAERAANLTRQLLAFSRRQILEPMLLDLNQVTTEIERMLRRILGEDIDFVQKLAPDLGLTLADPAQVEQVLMNLAINARDAMPEGGKLTIETSNVELDDEYAASHVDVVQGPYVMLAVTDSGIGMDELTKSRIFEPFFTTKETGKGTGLGLSTVYGIVKQSGGSVGVYSEPGLGTTFKVYLPRKLEATAAATRPPMIRKQFVGTETILVVEDEEAVLNLSRRILAGAGYTVLTASSGAEALLACEKHPGDIHLVLTDIVMPQMSGKVISERLVKLRPGIKVLFMSGYTDNAIVHHGTLDPGTRFIGKPFNAADLTRKVREVLDERRS